MAKKRFTDSFDSLFGDPMEEQLPKEDEVRTGRPATDEHSVADDEEDGKKASGKTFTDSLQSFLSETFEASFERQMAEAEKQKEAKPKARKPRRRRSGLDMLIRSTVEPSKVEIEEGDQPKRRRITLTFEPQKLEKLKSIAKVEKAMLKDIINDLVGEYIRQYETGKKENL